MFYEVSLSKSHLNGSWGTFFGLAKMFSTALVVMKFLSLFRPHGGCSSRLGTGGFSFSFFTLTGLATRR